MRHKIKRWVYKRRYSLRFTVFNVAGRPEVVYVKNMRFASTPIIANDDWIKKLRVVE